MVAGRDDGGVIESGGEAARDDGTAGSWDTKVSVGQRWLFLCPYAYGRICPIKQSQVGLHPIENQTRKGYEREWLWSMLWTLAGVLILGSGGGPDGLQDVVGLGREPDTGTIS